MLITVDQSDDESCFKEMVLLLRQCLDRSLMQSFHNYPIAHAAWRTAVEEEWNKRKRRRRSRGMKREMKDPRISFKLIRSHVEEHTA